MSAKDWEVLTIESLIDEGVIIAHKDGNHGSNYPRASEFVDEGVPFLTAKLLDEVGNIDLKNAPRLSKERAEKFKFGFVETNDVLLSHNATVGRVAVVPELAGRVLIGTSLTHYRVDETRLLPKYLAAYFSGVVFQNQLASVMSQTTRNQVPITSQRKLSVIVPPVVEQKQIADVLGSFSDKVRLNRQTNQTLEKIAQAIFKSWFVDFEPTRAKIIAQEMGADTATQELAAQAIICGALTLEQLADIEQNLAATLQAAIHTKLSHNSPTPINAEQLATTAALFPNALVESELGEMPEGWDIGCLGDLIHFNPYRTLKKGTLAPYLDMKNVPTCGHLADEVIEREIGSGTKFINGDTLLARITPCLENGKTAYVDFLDEGQVAWGSTEYIVMRPKDDYPESLGYLIARNAEFRQYAIQSMTGTSGRQRANAKVLETLSWVVYPKEIVNAFDKIAGVYLSLAKSRGDENKSLAELRDTLLPKLLSGELDVSALANDSAPAIKTKETFDV